MPLVLLIKFIGTAFTGQDDVYSCSLSNATIEYSVLYENTYLQLTLISKIYLYCNAG